MDKQWRLHIAQQELQLPVSVTRDQMLHVHLEQRLLVNVTRDQMLLVHLEQLRMTTLDVHVHLEQQWYHAHVMHNKFVEQDAIVRQEQFLLVSSQNVPVMEDHWLVHVKQEHAHMIVNAIHNKFVDQEQQHMITQDAHVYQEHQCLYVIAILEMIYLVHVMEELLAIAILEMMYLVLAILEHSANVMQDVHAIQKLNIHKGNNNAITF